MKKVILLLIFLMLIPAAAGKEGNIHVLAVSETETGYKGSTATLELDISAGKERVFLETIPLTKVGTQISLRFAKQIACQYLDISCENFDFLYTLKADTTIIGGPSAGASATILTVALLDDLELKKDVAITGTINSGGFIGPVGSIKEKIESAQLSNITTILIPAGKSTQEINNQTINLIEYGETLGINVIEVSTLNDALFYFTGIRDGKKEATFTLDEDYVSVMKKLAEDLCARTDILQKEIEAVDFSGFDMEIQNLRNRTINFTRTSEITFGQKKYYTAASFCFRANIDTSYLKLYAENSTELIEETLASVDAAANDLALKVDGIPIDSIQDLQTYMIVKERIRETEEQIARAKDANTTETKAFITAFAGERLESALSWSTFFTGADENFELSQKRLIESCSNKIAEAQERLNYIMVLYDRPMPNSRELLEAANDDFKDKEYASCLFKASKAKAEANGVLTSVGVGLEEIDNLIQNKLEAVEQIIAQSQQSGVFPIVGYSYYEYSNSLKDTDKPSSLLFAEYALELSGLDIYFEKKESPIIEEEDKFEKGIIFVLIAGVLIGIVSVWYIVKD